MKKINIWESKKINKFFYRLSIRWPRLKRYAGYWILISSLARRDISARYARSSLGFIWAVLDPLLYLMVFGVLRSFLGISSGDMPYLIFLFSGLTAWNMLLSIINNSPAGVMSNASIMKKTLVPRELFVLVSTVTAIFDYCMAMIIMFAMMVIYKIPFTWNLLWLPALVFLTVLLGLGIGMWVTSIGIFKRDILKIISYILQLCFFLSPIFYPINSVPAYIRPYYVLNPLVGLLQGFRNVLGAGLEPDFNALGMALPAILLIFFIGWINFRRKSVYFADYL